MDSRENTTNFWIVRVGKLDKQAPVVSQEDFGVQLNKVLAGLLGDEGGKSELLFQLRERNFIEKAEGNLE